MTQTTSMTAANVYASVSQGSYDRARGGIIKVKLKIPEQTYQVQGSCTGTVKTKAMEAEFEIDVEQLPLVNVAGYTIEEEQVALTTLDYPADAVVINITQNFG